MRTTLLFVLIFWSVSCLAQTKIRLEEHQGVYLIPCKVNGLPMKFIFDTGASDVSLSLTEALFMLKNGYLSESDFTGTENYQIANGDIQEGYTLIIRSIEIGDKRLTNVKASIVMNSNAPLLLGQSAISKLGSYNFDYANNLLTIGESTRPAASSYSSRADYTKPVVMPPRQVGWTGSTRNGKYHGYGTYTFPDGTVYVGELKDGVTHGYGTFNFPDGRKYVGEFAEGKYHGRGTFWFSNGQQYDGEFRNNMQHGQGTYSWPDGKVYVGEFRNDKINGQGILTDSKGQRYVGKFEDGKYVGK